MILALNYEVAVAGRRRLDIEVTGSGNTGVSSRTVKPATRRDRCLDGLVACAHLTRDRIAPHAEVIYMHGGHKDPGRRQLKVWSRGRVMRQERTCRAHGAGEPPSTYRANQKPEAEHMFPTHLLESSR